MWYESDLMGGPQSAGVIGTSLLYHFIATMDYANRALILRRKTRTQQLHMDVRHSSGSRLPLWIAGDHIPCSLGSLNDYGPRVASLDTGGMGMGVITSEDNAERAGIQIDYEHPVNQNGVNSYLITPARISLGHAVGRNIPGIVAQFPWREMYGFEPIANFTHEYFKPFAITFDYASMHFSIAIPPGTSADRPHRTNVSRAHA